MAEGPRDIPQEDAPEPSLVASIAETARSLIDKVRLVAIVAAGAGAWLWVVFYYPFGVFEEVGRGLAAVLVGGLLLLPSGVLFVFYGGLRELSRLPQRVSGIASSGREDVRGAAEHVKAVRRARSKPWRLVQAIWAMRGLVVRRKAALVKYVAAARLFTAPVLFLVILALVMSLVLVVVAVVSLPLVLVAWLFG